MTRRSDFDLKGVWKVKMNMKNASTNVDNLALKSCQDWWRATHWTAPGNYTTYKNPLR